MKNGIEWKVDEEIGRILSQALLHGKHAEECPAGQWQQKNKYLPSNHPARAFCPKCNCWRADALRVKLDIACHA